MIESSSTTTSRPHSTSRLARSSTISATWTWLRAISSEDEATTSPRTLRRMSVTSSGRSSTSSTMRWISGWFSEIEWAIFCSRTVLPALGGATIRQRWPLPIGAIRSTTRVETPSDSHSRGGSAPSGSRRPGS